MPVERIQKVMITPLNSQPVYSFKKGNPIINFQIEQDGMLMGKSSYLHFKLRVNTQAGALPDNNGNISGVPSVITINERIGVLGMIERVNVSELKSNQTIESRINVGREKATTMPSSHSKDEYLSSLSNKLLVAPRKSITGNLVNREISVSIPLHEVSGLMAQEIPLSHLPLMLSLQLASDEQFLTASAANSLAFYEVKDPYISADIMILPPDLKNQLDKQKTLQIQFETKNSIYNVQNSSNSTTNLNWGLSKVKSVFTNVVPTNQTNNISVDSFETTKLKTGANYGSDAELNRVLFSRGAVAFPIEDELEVLKQSQETNPMVPVLKSGLTSVVPYKMLKHTLVDLETQTGKSTDLTSNGVKLSDLSAIGSTDSKPVFTLGVDLDSFSNQGVNFRNTTFGLRLDTNMDGQSPMGLYSFAVNKNTLLMNEQGIQVLS